MIDMEYAPYCKMPTIGEKMKIGELSVLSGYSLDTIRFYEKLGIITSSKKGYFRDYNQIELEKCFFVERLKKIGLPLNDIKEIFILSDKIGTIDCLTNDDKKAMEKLLHLFDSTYKKALDMELEIVESKKVLAKSIKKIKTLLEEMR